MNNIRRSIAGILVTVASLGSFAVLSGPAHALNPQPIPPGRTAPVAFRPCGHFGCETGVI